MQDFVQVLNAGDILIAVRMSISSPSEIYSIDLASGTATNISNINTPVLSQLTLGDVEERWVKTTDGKDMLVWLSILPTSILQRNTRPSCTAGRSQAVSQF